MMNFLKNTPVVNIATKVEGDDKLVVVRVPMDAVDGIVAELPEWKRFNRSLGNKWGDVSTLGVALMSLEYGDMAVKGLQPHDDHLMAMHRKGLIWLLHRRGKIVETKARAEREMAVLKITPGLGFKGLRISFEAIPSELFAANDNMPAAAGASRLH